MAMRQRFKPSEREAFVVKTEVEWLHGSHWRPGIIVHSIEVDELGRPYVGITNQGATRTISDGQYLRGYPGAIRLRDGHAALSVSGCTDTRADKTPEYAEAIDHQSQLF